MKLLDALLPGVVFQTGAQGVLLGLVQREPGLNALSRLLRRLSRGLAPSGATKIEGGVTGHFSEHRDIAQHQGDAVLSRFNQRQAKAFALACGDQAGTRGVDLFKILVANAFKPKKLFIQFRMFGEDLCNFGDVPANFADDE